MQRHRRAARHRHRARLPLRRPRAPLGAAVRLIRAMSDAAAPAGGPAARRSPSSSSPSCSTCSRSG
ncbi:MAG: hypothetical protein MZV49_06040 [Rhodopseudomonas palustris]|nr:hypothetical protein [Rhodopseudomonas palustris]